MMRPNENEELMTIGEAARVLGLTRQRVHQLVALGRLTGVSERRHKYVVRAEIMARASQENATEGLLDALDVAARFGVKRKRVYHWVSTGRLPAVRTNTRRILFDPGVVDAFIPPSNTGRTSKGTKDERREQGPVSGPA